MTVERSNLDEYSKMRRVNTIMSSTLVAAICAIIGGTVYITSKEYNRQTQVRKEAYARADTNRNGILEEGELVNFVTELMKNKAPIKIGDLEITVRSLSPDHEDFKRYLGQQK